MRCETHRELVGGSLSREHGGLTHSSPMTSILFSACLWHISAGELTCVICWRCDAWNAIYRKSEKTRPRKLRSNADRCYELTRQLRFVPCMRWREYLSNEANGLFDDLSPLSCIVAVIRQIFLIMLPPIKGEKWGCKLRRPHLCVVTGMLCSCMTARKQRLGNQFVE